MELASQQIMKKNLNKHEVLKVRLHDSKFPPFAMTTDIIPSEKTKELQKTKVISLVMEENDYDYVIGTDGSTLKQDNCNLGPSAAAAIVFKKDNMRDPIDVIQENLGIISHNYEAELVGLNLALKYLQHQKICHSKVLIVSDCIPAMEATFTQKITKDYNHTIMSNKNILYDLKTTNNNNIDVVWAPSHQGIQLNEMADVFAKEEAAKKVKIQRPLERKVVLLHLKQEVLVNWQKRVDLELTDHQIMEINQYVKSWRIHNIKGSKHLTRLVTGHHFLNSFQSKVNPARVSRCCTCGQVETLNHYLFLCQKYIRFRKKWQYKVVSITDDIGALVHISLATAFGQRLDLPEEKNKKLQESLCTYILETERFS